jgi:hypothetical protein
MTKTDVGLRVTGDQVASAVGADTSPLSKLLETEEAILTPMFGEEEQLEAEAASTMIPEPGEPHLAQFYNVEAEDAKLDKLAQKLLENPLVESAYVKPPAELAVIAEAPEVMEELEIGEEAINEMPPSPEAPAATPNFVSRQGYLNPAPVGVNARYAWRYLGGRGRNVRVIDLEWGWNFTHEDLRQNQGGVIAGNNSASNNHGTAVVGEIGGDRNAFGVTGISPDAVVSAVSFTTIPTARAIRLAADRLRPGDIMLLEIHRSGPAASGAGQHGYIAVEWWPDDYAAIRYATRKGVIVVEAAGNGSQNLDDAIYNQRPPGFPATWRNPFNPANPSSRAVVVGAGAPPPGTHGRNHGPDRSRLGFSNYGRRVDCQGWGREVTTTGYGDLQGGADPNRWYTDQFSGTSSASPIVVGAIACLQGILRARRMRLLTPSATISLLRTTGSPQTDAPGRPRTQRIGNRPNLQQMIARFIRPRVRTAPLYRYWKPAGGDHFYTTNFRELGRGRLGYRYEGIQCYIFPRRVRGTVPLYRYWNPRIVDHFYTTNFRELGRGAHGWRLEGIQGWVYSRRVRGTVPLYRYWNPRIGDHFYTTNFRELGRGAHGWRYEGVQCFVCPRPRIVTPSVEGGMGETLEPEQEMGEQMEGAEMMGAMEMGLPADELEFEEGTGEGEELQSLLQRMGIPGFEQYNPDLNPDAQAGGYPEATFDDMLEADLGAEGGQLSPAELMDMGEEMFEPEALEAPFAEGMGVESFTVEPSSEMESEQLLADSFTTAAENEGLAPQDSFTTSEQRDEQGNIIVNLNLGKK